MGTKEHKKSIWQSQARALQQTSTRRHLLRIHAWTFLLMIWSPAWILSLNRRLLRCSVRRHTSSQDLSLQPARNSRCKNLSGAQWYLRAIRRSIFWKRWHPIRIFCSTKQLGLRQHRKGWVRCYHSDLTSCRKKTRVSWKVNWCRDRTCWASSRVSHSRKFLECPTLQFSSLSTKKWSELIKRVIINLR